MGDSAGGPGEIRTGSQAMGQGYPVQCWRCRGEFDAMDAPWCSCLTSERTLVCPHCLKCFCAAPPTYAKGFWNRAPEALYRQRRSDAFDEHLMDPPPLPEAVKRPLVLVCDDNRDLLQLARDILDGLGCGVLLGRDGQEGLRLARAYKPQLVLTDALMPKIGGREMCRLLKEDPVTAEIPVVIMTSVYTATKYALEAQRQFKADQYYIKPLEHQRLRDLLEKYIG